MNQCACEDQPEFSRALSVYRNVKAEEKHSPEKIREQVCLSAAQLIY